MKNCQKVAANIEKSIGQILTNLRKESGLSQKELARLLECNNSSLSKIENDARLPTPAMLNKMLKIYGKYLYWKESEVRITFKELEEHIKAHITFSPKHHPNTLEHQSISQFKEFTTLSTALPFLVDLTKTEPHTLDIQILAATGGTTLSSVLPTILRNTLAKVVNVSLYVINPHTPFIQFIPEHWTNEVVMTLNRVSKGGINSPNKQVCITVFSYSFMPTLHGIMINKQHLFLGFFGWGHFSGRLELSGAENTHRYYSRTESLNAEYYFHIFEDWVANMPCEKVFTNIP